MRARITGNTGVTRRYLDVDEAGVTFCETDSIGGVHHISYDEIDAVLLSSNSVLSIQIGRTIYRIAYIASNREHQAAARMLADGCRNALASSKSRSVQDQTPWQ